MGLAAPSQLTTRQRCAKHSYLVGLAQLGLLATMLMGLGSSGICSDQGWGWGMHMAVCMDRVSNMLMVEVVVAGQQQIPRL